ncbi:histidine-containing phosphotransfer protein 1-like [Benincasa hispida]|uniref:histidine-containing phosphotransfer protein 1-like n=1 Tax=Benincasa hispida TaxID=102211 RepID=UPI00190211F0|nr:histidine-containing phosphotransfer protein 1-like [Benincasa hispida]
MSASASSSSSRPPAGMLHPHRFMIEKFIDALREQGFLDEDFNKRRNLPENQDSLARFCGEAEPKLETIEKALASENVDFRSVINTVEMIRSGAARVGGTRVASACTDLQQHCNSNNIEGSNAAYKKLSWEYYVLRDCFHHILQAERTLED